MDSHGWLPLTMYNNKNVHFTPKDKTSRHPPFLRKYWLTQHFFKKEYLEIRYFDLFFGSKVKFGNWLQQLMLLFNIQYLRIENCLAIFFKMHYSNSKRSIWKNIYPLVGGKKHFEHTAVQGYSNKKTMNCNFINTLVGKYTLESLIK